MHVIKSTVPLINQQTRAKIWAGIFKQSMGARNRVGIGLSYHPARLHRLAESIPWNRFLGILKGLQIRALAVHVLTWWDDDSRRGRPSRTTCSRWAPSWCWPCPWAWGGSRACPPACRTRGTASPRCSRWTWWSETPKKNTVNKFHNYFSVADLWLMDLDADPDPVIFVSNIQGVNKFFFLSQFFAWYFLKVHVLHFSKGGGKCLKINDHW